MLYGQDLGEAEARIALDTCVRKLCKRSKAAVVAVVDRHGELLAPLRNDGCALPSIVTAQNKAYTSGRVRKPSEGLGRSAKPMGRTRMIMEMCAMSAPRSSTMATTWLRSAGWSGEEDVEIACIGVDTILSSLPR